MQKRVHFSIKQNCQLDMMLLVNLKEMLIALQG